MIYNFNFDSTKNGSIKLVKPSDFNATNTDINFSFKFEQLDFWNKIIPISGDINGDISYKNGIIKAKMNGNKLIFQNAELTSYHSIIDVKKFRLQIKMNNISYQSGRIFLLKLQMVI